MSFTRFPPFRLMRIGKRGNGYLRMLLIHGARTALPGLPKKETSLGRWLIPNPIDQNPWAHWRSPMDMMRQG
jgi:hypothetical protein